MTRRLAQVTSWLPPRVPVRVDVPSNVGALSVRWEEPALFLMFSSGEPTLAADKYDSL
jgi:hypothetical protein